jgi:hypothetical protein
MLVSAMEDVIDKLSPVQSSEKRLTDEMIENGITTLATLHAKQSVGDYAVGYITGAKFARDFYNK